MKKTFKYGLRKKLRLAIIGMLRTMITKVANPTRKIEEEMPTIHRNRQFQPLLDNEDPNEKSTNHDQKGKEEKDTRRVNAMYGGSLLVSQWCFLLGTPCSKAYGE
jgi:hypothetical protein